MPPKPRQIKVQQQSTLAAMQALEQRSDEELEREQRHKAAALALLGARAAERYDATASREYFRRAVAASRPQERMALRRMADASIALAERDAGELKSAMERLGQAPPSNRQLMIMRFTSLIVPPQGASALLRVRGILLLIGIVILLLAVGAGLVQLAGLAFGGVSLLTSIWAGILLVAVALGVLIWLGRRRQRRAVAARAQAGG
jgi:hypothetical protein